MGLATSHRLFLLVLYQHPQLLRVRGHVPACSLYYLFMDLLSASLSGCFVNLLLLSASSLIWRQAPEVPYLLSKELIFNIFFSRSQLGSGQFCAHLLSCIHDLQTSIVTPPSLLQNEKPEPFWCLFAGQLPCHLDLVCCVPCAT